MRKPWPTMNCRAMGCILSSSDIVLKTIQKNLIIVNLKEDLMFSDRAS